MRFGKFSWNLCIASGAAFVWGPPDSRRLYVVAPDMPLLTWMYQARRLWLNKTSAATPRGTTSEPLKPDAYFGARRPRSGANTT